MSRSSTSAVATRDNTSNNLRSPASSSTSVLNRSLTQDKFSSLMSMLSDAETRAVPSASVLNEQKEMNEKYAAGGSRSQQRSSSIRPLSASSPRGATNSSPSPLSVPQRTPQQQRSTNSLQLNIPAAKSAASLHQSSTSPRSPASSSSYSSETFSPVSSPRASDSAQQVGRGANPFFTPTKLDQSQPRKSNGSDISPTIALNGSNHTAARSSVSPRHSAAFTSPVASSPSTSDASSLSTTLKSRLLLLKQDLHSKELIITQLQDTIQSSSAQHQHERAAAQQNLQSQRTEYELLLKSNQDLVSKLLDDKSSLSAQCDRLSTELKKNHLHLTQRDNDTESLFQARLTKEIGKAKEVWQKQELVTREKLLVERTRTLKADTLKSLEPEIQKLLQKAALSSKEKEFEIERKWEGVLRQVKDEHEVFLQNMKRIQMQECVRVKEEERMDGQRRMNDMKAEYERREMEQKQRYQLDLSNAQSLLTSSTASHSASLDSMLQSMKKDHALELARMKEHAKHEVEELKRHHSLHEAQEKERNQIEKETWLALSTQKIQRDLLERERTLKETYRKQQEEEIELIITKLTKENEEQVRELVREYEKKLENGKRQTSSDLVTMKRQTEDAKVEVEQLRKKLVVVEEKYDATFSQLSSLQAQLTSKQHRLNELEESHREMEKKLTNAQKDAGEKFTREKHQLRQQFLVMQSRIDSIDTEKVSLQKEAKSQLEQALKKKDEEHERQLEVMQTRVKELMEKKDRVNDALKKEVEKMQHELHTQQRELMEQMQ